jgi:predicted DNA-binding transcriptional regulator AlpA
MLVVCPVRKPPSPPAESPMRLPIVDRLAGMDARMSTSDVVRIVGVNRSTLFRWCKKGLFPQKHISGGWLRSDVEQWFIAKAIQGS